MNTLNQRPRIALLLSALIAGGTVVAIAASDRPRALWHTLWQMQPLWLLAALAAELLAPAMSLPTARRCSPRGVRAFR
jgi:hypothetical protein